MGESPTFDFRFYAACKYQKAILYFQGLSCWGLAVASLERHIALIKRRRTCSVLSLPRSARDSGGDTRNVAARACNEHMVLRQYAHPL